MAYTASKAGIARADGTCTVTVGPERANEQWDVVAISVIVTGSPTAEVYIYEGSVGDSNFFDSSYVGIRNHSAIAPGTLQLSANEYLTAYWTGVTEGATCTVRVKHNAVH